MNDVRCVVLTKFDDVFEIFANSFLEMIGEYLLVVDDGLSESIRSKYNTFEYIGSPRPFAISRACNLGFSYKYPYDILRFDDDMIIKTPQAHRVLQTIAYRQPEIGIVVPMMTNVMCPLQDPVNKVDKEYIILAPTDDNVSMGGNYIKRDVINIIGGYDEEFGYMAGGNDHDYCNRVRLAGFKVAIAQRCLFQHGGEPFSSVMSNTRSRCSGQLETVHDAGVYLSKKWGASGYQDLISYRRNHGLMIEKGSE